MEHEILTGARGGKYWIDEKGKKHYVSQQGPVAKPNKSVNKLPSPTQQKTKKVQRVGKYEVIDIQSPPKTYIGYYVEYDSRGIPIDDFKEWCHAYSEQEAEREFKNRYWRQIENKTIRLSLVQLER